MKIIILGKCDPNNKKFYNTIERMELSPVGQGFVFVDYLSNDMFLGDIFILDDSSEIRLSEIKLKSETIETLTEIGRGWKCLCRFEGLDLEKIPAVRDWFLSNYRLVATKKNRI